MFEVRVPAAHAIQVPICRQVLVQLPAPDKDHPDIELINDHYSAKGGRLEVWRDPASPLRDVTYCAVTLQTGLARPLLSVT